MKEMKKVIFLFAIILSVNLIFAQEFNESKRILTGDLSLISEDLSDLALASLENSELRLLRNMIYAKYGHTFDSEDLSAFYSKFDWYKAQKKISDSRLNANERKLVQRLLIFETRNESEPSLNFGNEIIGVWHVSAIMPDTWLDRFVIGTDKKMEFLVSYFEKNPEISEYLGHYSIKGNTLFFYVDTLVKQGKKLELKEPLLFKFPVTSISEVEFMNGELKRQMITIGSYNYYLVYGDPRRG